VLHDRDGVPLEESLIQERARADGRHPRCAAAPAPPAPGPRERRVPAWPLLHQREPWEGSRALPRRGCGEQARLRPHADTSGNPGVVCSPWPGHRRRRCRPSHALSDQLAAEDRLRLPSGTNGPREIRPRTPARAPAAPDIRGRGGSPASCSFTVNRARRGPGGRRRPVAARICGTTTARGWTPAALQGPHGAAVQAMAASSRVSAAGVTSGVGLSCRKKATRVAGARRPTIIAPSG
jgi:hypothetical protein